MTMPGAEGIRLQQTDLMRKAPRRRPANHRFTPAISIDRRHGRAAAGAGYLFTATVSRLRSLLPTCRGGLGARW